MLAGDYTLEVIAASISFLGRNASSFRHKPQTQTEIGPIGPIPVWLLDSAGIRPKGGLQRLNVRRLPSLGTLHHVELHGLSFLQALEPA